MCARRFEDFIDIVINDGKEIIFLGYFNTNLLDADIDREQGLFITSLGLTQLEVNRQEPLKNQKRLLITYIRTPKKTFKA